MKLSQFVSISALFLAVWLGFTFMHDVPTQVYPRHDKRTAAHREIPTAPPLEMAAKVENTKILAISASR